MFYRGPAKMRKDIALNALDDIKIKGERSQRALTYHSDWGKVGQPMQRVGELLDFGTRNSDRLQDLELVRQSSRLRS